MADRPVPFASNSTDENLVTCSDIEAHSKLQNYVALHLSKGNLAFAYYLSTRETVSLANTEQFCNTYEARQ
ncbi:hypothetical protein P3T76_005420 [Phytophthora citrophthora]|uniref:Uncharacterized protein n=1 Tax=Phytophthora citrophthora TaxID=4793 RepID=A0AAD9GRA0_9STRA|nr:hypothetical protein P3T76_005420 [Phytophthora citrophthora]